MATSTVALDRDESNPERNDGHAYQQNVAEYEQNPIDQNLDADNAGSSANLDRKFVAGSPGSREGGRDPWVLLSFLLVCGVGMYFVIASDGTKKKPRDTEKPAVFEIAKPRAKVVPGKEEEPPKEPIAEAQDFTVEPSTPTGEDLERRKELEEKRKRVEASHLARIKSAIIIAGGQGAFHPTSATLTEPNRFQAVPNDGSFPVLRHTNIGDGEGETNPMGGDAFLERNPGLAFPPTEHLPRPTQRRADSATDPNERFFIEKSDQSRDSARATRWNHLAHTVMQGKIIDCVLETAIQSDLPGQLRCSISNDVYAESGRAVMLPAKTRMIGHYNSSVRKGQVRVFVIWQRAIAPNGIDIQLDSPGTDELGRAGIGGEVDNHYLEIFGVSAMLSIIGAGASSYGVGKVDQPNSDSAYRQAIQQSFAQTSQQVLSPYAQIAPTIHVNQGEAIKIFVNLDLDFSNVYAIRPDSTQRLFTEIQ